MDPCRGEVTTVSLLVQVAFIIYLLPTLPPTWGKTWPHFSSVAPTALKQQGMVDSRTTQRFFAVVVGPRCTAVRRGSTLYHTAALYLGRGSLPQSSLHQGPYLCLFMVGVMHRRKHATSWKKPKKKPRGKTPHTDSKASFHQHGRERGGLGPSLLADSSPAGGRRKRERERERESERARERASIGSCAFLQMPNSVGINMRVAAWSRRINRSNLY